MTEEAYTSAPMRRLHPLTMIYRGIAGIPAFAFGLYYAMQNRTAWMLILLTILGVVFVVPGIVLRYFYFRFRISEREVYIKSGVFLRRQRHIPLERIQNVEIQQNLLQRVLGIARISMETAGGGETEGTLEFVSVQDAQEIREIIRSFQRDAQSLGTSPINTDAEVSGQPRDGYSEPQTDISPELVSSDITLFAMSPADVLRCGMFKFSLLFFAFVLSWLQLLNTDPEDAVIGMITQQLRTVEQFGILSLIAAIAATAIIALLLAWITGIIFTFNKYYNFKLTADKGKLYVRRGLLTLIQGAVPLKKLQMMVIASNPIMRKFDYCGLELQTAGIGSKQQSAEVAVPLATSARVEQLAREIRPYVMPDQLTRVSRKTIRRAFVRYMFLTGILTLAASMALPNTVWLLLIAPLLYGAAVLRYRCRGYAVSGDSVIIKQGFLWQRIAIIPIEKIQTLIVAQSFFQRRLGLASVYVDTAATSSARDAGIIDIDHEDAHRIFAELSALFHAFGRSGHTRETGDDRHPQR